ncbi:diguanylate cyclase [Oscillatoriales cyanobacterium USR001]|nr:diguanylate cyclase [Oscillatoriales cyanobacterium USR001]
MSEGFVSHPLQFENQHQNLCLESSLIDLALFDFQVDSAHSAVEVAQSFQAHPLLPGVILTEQNQFLGMISRRRFFEFISRPYGVDLFSNRPIHVLYHMVRTDFLVLPGAALIVMAAQRAVQRSPELLYEPVVVKIDNGIYKLLDVHQLLLALSQIHEQATWYISELYYNLELAKSELEMANSELFRLASLDGLTQIANRRRFDEYLDREWQRLEQEQTPLSLILCDVDFFKIYNDTYGHQAGDRCLQQIAKALQDAVKSEAYLVARYGGEEFAVILPNSTLEYAAKIAEQIRVYMKALEIKYPQSPISPYVTLTFGIASVIPHSTTSKENLIAAADKALYQAKFLGRDRIFCF